MQNIRLNNGRLLPTLGLGTFKIKEPDVVKSVVEHALRIGYRLIDTAAVYQNEEFIGETLVKALPSSGLTRQDIFITSKLSTANHGKEKCKKAALLTMEKLKTDYLDLYLIHWPGASGLQPNDPQHKILRQESWLEMEEMHAKGQMKSIGVSNYTIAHLEEMKDYAKIEPAVLQVEVHPFLCQSELLEYCKRRNIHVTAYSSLGGNYGREDIMTNPTVVEIAKNQSRTVSQVLLRWAVQHGLSVIPKSTNEKRLQENSQIFDFNLTSDEMNKLNGLDQKHHYSWNPNTIA